MLGFEAHVIGDRVVLGAQFIATLPGCDRDCNDLAVSNSCGCRAGCCSSCVAYALTLVTLELRGTRVEVVRRGLHLLRVSVERTALRAQYAESSQRIRKGTLEELTELDGLSADGLQDK